MKQRIGMVMGVAVAVAMVAGVSARAEDGQKPPKKERPTPEAMFAKMDADSDGSVSKAEFEAAHAERMQRMAAHMGDKAPKMTAEQQTERMNKRFVAMDSNSDGVISKEEFVAGAQKMGPPGGEHGKHRKQGAGAPPPVQGEQGDQGEQARALAAVCGCGCLDAM